MPGLERLRVPRDQMNQKYICKQCKNIMIDSIECSKCRIQCCVECSSEVCNTFNQCTHSFSQINQELKKEVLNMYVKCRYNLQGCLKMSRFRDLELHEKTCEFAKMACDKSSCIQTQKQTKSANHQPDCPFAIIVCDKCKKQMRRIEQVNHDCVKWLQSIIENLNIQNDVQSEEIAELHEKGSGLMVKLDTIIKQDNFKIDELQKKNDFLQMYSQQLINNLEQQRLKLNNGISEQTIKVLEKTDIQIRKNECFIEYVKNLNDLCLEVTQKQATLLSEYSKKIECNYIQEQVDLNISNSLIKSHQKKNNSRDNTPIKINTCFKSPKLNKQKSSQSGKDPESALRSKLKK